RHTAPYIALRGTAFTIVSEESPSCGQCGRVCRVFWRDGSPWLLVRLRDGVMQSMPWAWTDLPIAPAQQQAQSDDRVPVVLSPTALGALVHHVRELRERDHVVSSR